MDKIKYKSYGWPVQPQQPDFNFNGCSDELAMKELGWTQGHFNQVVKELQGMTMGNVWSLSADAWTLMHYYRHPKMSSQIIME